MAYRDLGKKREAEARYWQNNTKSPNPNGFRISVDKARRFSSEPVRYEFCVKIKYQTGVGIYECANLSDGHPYCKACMAQQATAPAGQRFNSAGSAVFAHVPHGRAA
jgi:hypothetical protein